MQLPLLCKKNLLPLRVLGDSGQYLFEFSKPGYAADMKPIISRYESVSGVRVARCDVDNNPEYRKCYMDLVEAKGEIYLLPLYYNRKSQAVLYGPTSYDNFKKWAECRRDFVSTPMMYAYDGILKSSLGYRLLGFFARLILEKYYSSSIPAGKVMFE